MVSVGFVREHEGVPKNVLTRAAGGSVQSLVDRVGRLVCSWSLFFLCYHNNIMNIIQRTLVLYTRVQRRAMTRVWRLSISQGIEQ